jgi:hypothetical protein
VKLKWIETDEELNLLMIDVPRPSWGSDIIRKLNTIQRKPAGKEYIGASTP